jgi:hypothetical protein
MKTISFIIFIAALLFPPTTYAQGLTREEVQQQLVQAEQSGSLWVTDASYPAVGRIYEGQAKSSGYGGEAPGSLASGGHATTPRSDVNCVGPVSFCNIYAGS